MVWSGKLLDKNVFPKKEVGDYFNANFLNLHIDMEKGEGIEIAKNTAFILILHCYS